MNTWGIRKLADKTGDVRFVLLAMNGADVNRRTFRLLTAELVATKRYWVLNG